MSQDSATLKEFINLYVYKNVKIIFLYMKLHNFCIYLGDLGIDREMIVLERDKTIAEVKDWYAISKDTNDMYMNSATRSERNTIYKTEHDLR